MATLLESGGKVELWGGWIITLPPAYHETNPDGSWSAWGDDWVADAHVITTGRQVHGAPISAKDMLGEQHPVNIKGHGWVGNVKTLQEIDNGREVYRFAAHLAVPNTVLSLWVSYFEKHQQSFAEKLVNSVTHT